MHELQYQSYLYLSKDSVQAISNHNCVYLEHVCVYMILYDTLCVCELLSMLTPDTLMVEDYPTMSVPGVSVCVHVYMTLCV